MVDEQTLDFLAGYRFAGDIWGYAEGECYFPGSPLLVVEADFAEGVLLETLVLSILNHDSAIASAASRMTCAAGDRPCIEMGSRRTHEQAAVAAARAAYIAGFAATSQPRGRAHGTACPTAGTSAHAFTLLHDDERTRSRRRSASLGKGTTLLVDTYDVAAAVRDRGRGGRPGARRRAAGLRRPARPRPPRCAPSSTRSAPRDTRIVVTSDLDEYAIAALAAAPVDAYGVGTSLVTGSGAPTAGLVYKLVARADASGTMVGVAKKSKDKASVGGRKWALRRATRRRGGRGRGDRHRARARPTTATTARCWWSSCAAARWWPRDLDLASARGRHERSRAELPPRAHQLSRGEPAIPTVYETDRS